MEVIQRASGKWVIIHALREIAQEFDSESAAWSWADANIDDQFTCTPNWYSAPLVYKTAAPESFQSH